jgi:hypothetical protein
MNRLNKYALRTGKRWMSPVLNIHDDLTFILPEDRLDWAVPKIIRMMCDVPFKAAQVVPIPVEASMGRDWTVKTDIGKYRSDKLDEQLANFKSPGLN